MQVQQQWPRRNVRGRPGSARNVEVTCSACGRQFNRRDSLKRHREVHDSVRQQQKSRRRACESCVRSKTRCDEAYPTCYRCEQKTLHCVYSTANAALHRSNTSSRRTQLLGGSGDRDGDGDDGEEISTFRSDTALDTEVSTNNYAETTLLDDVFPDDDNSNENNPVAAYNETSPSFLMSPQETSALYSQPLPQQPPSQPPPPTWPGDAMTQFIGVGDFYPTWFRPSQVALDDLLTDNGVFGFSNSFPSPLRQNPMQQPESLHFTTVFQDALTAAFPSYNASDDDDGQSPHDATQANHAFVSFRTDAVGDGTFGTVVMPPSSAIQVQRNQRPPQKQQQQQQRTQTSLSRHVHLGDKQQHQSLPLIEDLTTTAVKSMQNAATKPREPREESTDRLPALELDPNLPEDGYVRQFMLAAVDQQTHKNLCDCIRLPLLRSPWQPMSLAAFPSQQQIDCFVDLYFGHFDWLLPMIHRPTFEPGADLVLTLSMCAIGVFYSPYANARTFGKSLCELLRRLLLCMSEQNIAVSRSFSYLAAQTLHCVLGNSSGSQRLFEFADNNRGVLVANARCVRLFDHHEHSLSPQDNRTNYTNQSLQARWEAWICAERARRLAWCIFIFDASATYYRNCRPHLSLSEMKVQLPCHADLWEAESAPAWAALRPWSNGTAPANASLSETMCRLFNRGSGSAPDARQPMSALEIVLDEFHRIIASTTLLRMVWDQRESMRSPLATVPRSLFAASAAHHPKVDVVLSLLRELTTDALRPAAASAHQSSGGDPPREEKEKAMGGDATGSFSRSSQEHAFRELVLRARVSLVSQIVAADRISHHLDTSSLRRGDGARRLPHEVAAHTLRAWADGDPAQPRRMARVGAQLLAISRLYSFNMPREPYDVFRAGLLLWTMVPLVQPTPSPSVTSFTRTQQLSPSSPSSRRQICQLDWLGAEDAPEAQVLRDWAEHGDPDGNLVLQIQGVPDISTELGTRQILRLTSDVLRKLSVWGAAKIYRDIIIRALQGGE